MANLDFKFASDPNKILQDMAKVVDKMKEMGDQTRKTAQQSSRGSDRAAGQMSRLGRSVLATVASYASLSQAIAQAKRVMDEYNQAAERAAGRNVESEMPMSKLAQLAGGDRARLRSLQQAARKTYAEGGAESLGQAAGLVFALESAGALQERGFFSKMYGVVEDPALFARAATTLQTSVGQRETGSLRNIISKGFAASAFAPSTAPELLEAASRGGGYAKALGMSDESLLSATALVSRSLGSAEEGGTAVASLLAAMTKEGGYKGMGLAQSVKRIQGMGMSDADLIKYLGRKEAFRAYSALSGNMGLLGEIETAVGKGQATDLAGSILQSAYDTDPGVQISRLSRQATARANIAEEYRGTQRQYVDASVARFVEARERAGKSALGTAAYRASFGAYRGIFGDEMFMREYGNPQGPMGMSPVAAGALGIGQQGEGYRQYSEVVDGLKQLTTAILEDVHERRNGASPMSPRSGSE